MSIISDLKLELKGSLEEVQECYLFSHNIVSGIDNNTIDAHRLDMLMEHEFNLYVLNSYTNKLIRVLEEWLVYKVILVLLLVIVYIQFSEKQLKKFEILKSSINLSLC